MVGELDRSFPGPAEADDGEVLAWDGRATLFGSANLAFIGSVRSTKHWPDFSGLGPRPICAKRFVHASARFKEPGKDELRRYTSSMYLGAARHTPPISSASGCSRSTDKAFERVSTKRWPDSGRPCNSPRH